MEYKTPDLYFAAYLQTTVGSMKRIDRVKNRAFFVFEAPEADIENLQTAWLNGSGTVSALALSNAIKMLKSAVHRALELPAPGGRTSD